jgi:hypothetical protein
LKIGAREERFSSFVVSAAHVPNLKIDRGASGASGAGESDF